MKTLSLSKKYLLEPIGSKTKIIEVKRNFSRCTNAYNGLNEGIRRMLEIETWLWIRYMKKNGLWKTPQKEEIKASEKRRKKMHEKKHKENRKRMKMSKWAIDYRRAVRRSIRRVLEDKNYNAMLIPKEGKPHKFKNIPWADIASLACKYISKESIVKNDEVLKNIHSLCWAAVKRDIGATLKLQRTIRQGGQRSKLKRRINAKTLNFDVNISWTIDGIEYQKPLNVGKFPESEFSQMRPLTERGLRNKFYYIPKQVSEDGVLNIPWIGSFQIVGWNSKQYGLPRRFWGSLRTMRLSLIEDEVAFQYLDYKGEKRKGLKSNFYASFSTEMEGIAKREKTNKQLGVDCGVRFLAYLSDNTKYINPFWRGWLWKKNFSRLSEDEKKLVKIANGLNKKLKFSSKRLSQRAKGSVIRMKARATLRKRHRQKTNFTDDYHNKVIIDIAKKNPDILKMENLNIKNMMKSAKGTEEEHGSGVQQKKGLNRALKDAKIYGFQQKLAAYLLRSGIEVEWVNPQYTSQKCFKCGEVHKENRLHGGEEFRCRNCGYESHADLNTAQNIASQAGKVKESLTDYHTMVGSPYALP